jgi:hypothetical protein
MWKKKKKKDNLIREQGQSATWHYSGANGSAAALSSLRTSDIDVPVTRLMRAERQNHRKKMKKERDKLLHVKQQEEVSYILKSDLIIC